MSVLGDLISSLDLYGHCTYVVQAYTQAHTHEIKNFIFIFFKKVLKLAALSTLACNAANSACSCQGVIPL